MVFWSWGRELEDSFDDANTQKLSHIIVTSSSSSTSAHTPTSRLPISTPHRKVVGHEEDEIEGMVVHDPNHDLDSESEARHDENHIESELYLRKSDSSKLLKLQRIPVMAIFHRNDSAGRGVPHSFASFLQRYPAVPQVVVSLSCYFPFLPKSTA